MQNALQAFVFYVIGSLILDWALFGQLTSLQTIARGEDRGRRWRYIASTNWVYLLPIVVAGACAFALIYVVPAFRTLLLVGAFAAFVALIGYRVRQRSAN
jgi:hypothetical protein